MFFQFPSTLKSDILSSQIGDGAYFTQIFCRETLNLLCLSNHVGNKTIFLLISSKNLINVIIIESNWRKTLFFTDLLHGNSKSLKYQVKLQKELVF